jgi:hypothetical protein
MFNKSGLIILFLFLTFFLFPVDLPQPKNGELFTEFDSFRYAKFLKKPIAGNGYIAMDGKEKFVFIQEKPLHVEIRKNLDKVTYKKGFNMPVDISNMSMDMFFLFEEPDVLNANYDISKNSINDRDEYTITPKQKSNLKFLKVTGKEDIFEKVELYFNDDSRIIYIFNHTVTGVKPDEKYFQL